jgi:hypothetical protein
MEEKIYDIEKLANNWKALYKDIQNNGKINFDLYNETFADTYQLLTQEAAESNVEKKYLSIIVNASLFAHADFDDHMESSYKAAVVLTERMLNTVISEEPKASRSEAKIYVLELRQEVSLSFENIGESINTLVKLYDGDFWDKFGQ